MKDYIVLDIETTGISPDFSQITEIGGAKVLNDQVVDTFDELINPRTEIPEKITAITGISNEMVQGARFIEEVLPDFLDFCGDLPILGHNIIFDYSFIKTNALKNELRFEKSALDTLELARKFLDKQKSYSLTNLIVHCGINRENAHRGLDDALATHELFQLIKIKSYDPTTLKDFTPKPILWRPQKQSPITDKQKKYLLSLNRQNHIKVDYEIDSLTKSEASRKIDFLIQTFGKSS
jgi:DNA polymerase-3 subunit alpha (Gram-positive type)